MTSVPFSADKRDLLELLLKMENVTDTTVSDNPVPVIQINGNDTFPLSFSQRRLWFLDQLEPGNPFYNFPFCVPFNVAVNTAVLERSINEIVQRHEALRTVFDAVDGEPVQVILPDLTVPLTVVDLRHLDGEGQEAEVVRLATEMAQRPFDLAGGPLLRTALLKRGRDSQVFVLVMHHIISDGWSLGIFWRELIALYNAYYVNRLSPLRELPIQYADFAVWQRSRLQGERLAELITYWKGQLEGMSALQLPTDRPRPQVLSYRGAFQEISLPRDLTEAVRDLSHDEGATLFMTLFSAFTVILKRYTGQDDIVVGSYVASRDRAELEDLIGFFINSLVLRVDLSGDPTFRDLLSRVREMALEAYAHQELPFEKLVEELQPERDLSRNPLFQVSFQLFSAKQDRNAAETPEAKQTIDLNRGMAIFDMAVNIWDGPDGLSGHIEYSTDLFDPTTMARLFGHFRTLLKSIVTNPDTHLSALQMLTDAERRQLLVDWNATAAETPQCCVHELFEQQVDRMPDAVAITSDGRDISYTELNRQANRLAHHLCDLGVVPGAKVGICATRGLQSMTGILAVLKAGAAYVPLDPSYPADRLAFMLGDSGAEIVLSESSVSNLLPSDRVKLLLLDDSCLCAGCSDANPAVALTPQDLCYIIYTSGSTGRPKGVLGPHRGIVNRLQWMWTTYPFGSTEVVCQKTALSFVDSIWEMFGGLLRGVRTVVLSDATLKDPRILVRALADEKISRIVLVPSLLRVLLASGLDLAEELPGLKYWTLSGEAFSNDLFTELQRALPDIVVLNLYGSSEVAADVLCCDLSRAPVPKRSVPIGRPIANTSAYVLDANCNPVPIGVSGELYVSGQGLSLGYHDRPDLTSENFITNPFTDAAGDVMYRTRDMARYCADGQIEYIGRIDHQVKVRGYRVELGEIETVLTQHGRVRQAVATVTQGQGDDSTLVAYVVPEDVAAVDVVADPDKELTSRWQSIWDETYRHDAEVIAAFDTSGWNSSYSGEPIPAAEMREWVDQTVARALSFRPTRVLEIGCGTGLILLQAAPHCALYVATDFSSVALEKVKAAIAEAPDQYSHVQLHEREATNFADLGGPFDLVILNSVVQYFPSAEYLSKVLRGAIGITFDTGAILIGDVRSLPLLPAYHTAVELRHASKTLLVEILQARIRKRVEQEKELAIDPMLFQSFGAAISQVTVDLKRGRQINEMVQFRHDITLRRVQAPRAVVPDRWLDWIAENLSIDRLSDMLESKRPGTLAVSGVPNARTHTATRALDMMVGQPFITVDELRDRLEQIGENGVDPEDLWAIGDALGYSVTIGISGTGGDGCFGVIFCSSAHTSNDFGFPAARTLSNGNESDYVTNPVSSVVRQSLVAELRAHLQNRLPQYMVPTSIVLLDRLPQSPNGKIDRHALAVMETAHGEAASVYHAPRSRTEQLLAAIWTDILNIERVGISDNFFELGGHSLLATQLVSRIRNEFGNELPVRAIFEAPTIASLAARIEQPTQDRDTVPKSGIRRLSRDKWSNSRDRPTDRETS
jgi:amino acid adenylation domain-containing protein